MSRILDRYSDEAIRTGRYFTGKPCRHGHIAERDMWTGNCLACYPSKKPKQPRPKYSNNMVLPTLKEPREWRPRVFVTADMTDNEVFDLMDRIDALRRARDPYVRPACYGLTPFEQFDAALHPDDLDTIDESVNN